MHLSDLLFRPSVVHDGTEFARLPRWHLTIWRHDGGSTYTIDRTGYKKLVGLDPATAQSVLFEITRAFPGKVGTGFPQEMRPA